MENTKENNGLVWFGLVCSLEFTTKCGFDDYDASANNHEYDSFNFN